MNSCALETSTKTEKLISQSIEIGEDVETLFGADSSEAKSYGEIEKSFRAEWDRLRGSSALGVPALSFVGPAGQGKSTLVDLLIGGKLPKSNRIRWIGPHVPQSLHPKLEEELRVLENELPELGANYTLVDTPGDAWSLKGSALFQIMLASSRLKVLVLNGEKIEAAEWQHVANACRGSFVLPAIRMSAKETQEYPGNHDVLIKQWREENYPDFARVLSVMGVEEPVFIPELRAVGGVEKHEETARRNLIHALKKFLAKHQADASERDLEIKASEARFLTALEPIISRFGGELARERTAELERAVGELPRDIVNELLADKRHLRSWFRLDARVDLMNRISPLAFPFRSIASLLCFTTGSWDRLIMSSTGSAPSAVLTLMGSAKQKREDDEAVNWHSGTPMFFKAVARRKLAVPWTGFLSAMEKADVALENHSDPFLAVQISGEDDLIELWMREKGNAAAVQGRWPAIVASAGAWFGALVFWLMLLGPLVHTYAQYIPTALKSLWGNWTPENFASYPVMPAAFWVTVILLSLIPCFLIALSLVAWWLREGRTRVFLKDLRLAMEGRLADSNAGLTVSYAHPQLTAYRRLAKRLRGSSQSF